MAEIKYVGNDAITEVISKTKTALSGKVDKADGKGLSTNDYTTAEKNKLAGITAGAQVNVIETIKLKKDSSAATDLTPSSKAVTIDVSDKVTAAQVKAYNDLTNYYNKTNSYSKEEVNSLISGLETIQFSIVESLPEIGESNVIYLVAHAHSPADNNLETGTANSYDEYAWIAASSSFEKIGSTDIDLSGYIQSDKGGSGDSQSIKIGANKKFAFKSSANKEIVQITHDSSGVNYPIIQLDQYNSQSTLSQSVKLLAQGFRYREAESPYAYSTVVSWSNVATKTYVDNSITGNCVLKTLTVNGHALNQNITITASDVGAVPTTRKVNNKALSSDITLGISDIDSDIATKTWVGQQGFSKDTHTAMTATEIDTIWAAA